MEAIGNGNTEIVKILVAAGADVNMKGEFDDTALHSAASSGHIDIVKILLAQGADVNDKDNQDRTALMLAEIYNHDDIVRILKQHIVAQTLPRHLERQQDRENLAMAMSEKDVGNRGDGTMPLELRHKIGEYLGGGNGKRKSRKSKKSKRKTRKTRRK